MVVVVVVVGVVAVVVVAVVVIAMYPGRGNHYGFRKNNKDWQSGK